MVFLFLDERISIVRNRIRATEKKCNKNSDFFSPNQNRLNCLCSKSRLKTQINQLNLWQASSEDKEQDYKSSYKKETLNVIICMS